MGRVKGQRFLGQIRHTEYPLNQIKLARRINSNDCLTRSSQVSLKFQAKLFSPA